MGRWWGDDGSSRWIDDDPWVRPEPVQVPTFTDALVDLPVVKLEEVAEPDWGSGPTHPIVAYSRDVLGLTLKPRQAMLLSELYRDGIREGVLRLGRRSGKGRMASVTATFEATVNADAHLAVVPPGEQVAIVVVANSREQAQIIHKFVRSYFERPELAYLVKASTAESIELHNGIVLMTLPCNARSTRGLAVAVVILDEAAWFVDTDGSPISGQEVWDALVPATAQFPAGKVLVLSTPRWSTGWFAELCRQADTGDFPRMRHWHATTAQMNPSIPVDFLAAEEAKDPQAYRREYLALFDAGVGAVFEAAAVRAAVVKRGPLPPTPAHTYTVAIDPAYTGDTFAAVVGHRVGEQLVVDRVQGWRGTRAAPLNHRAVLDEVAGIAAAYNGAVVLLDQYAAEPIAQGLAERGVAPQRRPWRNELKADAVTTLRQMFYAGEIELPQHAELIGELTSFEQRLLPSGKPRFAAPSGQHDDYASALLALAHHTRHGGYTGASFSMVA